MRRFLLACHKRFGSESVELQAVNRDFARDSLPEALAAMDPPERVVRAYVVLSCVLPGEGFLRIKIAFNHRSLGNGVVVDSPDETAALSA